MRTACGGTGWNDDRCYAAGCAACTIDRLTRELAEAKGTIHELMQADQLDFLKVSEERDAALAEVTRVAGDLTSTIRIIEAHAPVRAALEAEAVVLKTELTAAREALEKAVDGDYNLNGYPSWSRSMLYTEHARACLERDEARHTVKTLYGDLVHMVIDGFPDLDQYLKHDSVPESIRHLFKKWEQK